MSSSLSRGFYSGLIGGLFAGIWIFVWVFLQGGWTTMPEIISLEFWSDYFIFHLGLHAIFGGIVGIIYSKVFYNALPSKSFKKGLLYGLLIGMWANLFLASLEMLRWSLSGVEYYLIDGKAWIEGFLKWIPYGLVLGFVYERLRL